MGFVCKTVPHVALKSLAQNVALDAIFAKHQPIPDEKLRPLNDPLAKVPDETCQRLAAKLYEKEKREGKKAITEADRRRWLRPNRTSQIANCKWQEWEVPFDTDPDNTLLPTGADKVAARFVDSDYDGRTFCVTQAFFPDRSAWDKLARALKGVVDEAAFAAWSGTVSLPFAPGPHRRAAVKVIDPRGNEVLAVHRLDGKTKY